MTTATELAKKRRKSAAKKKRASRSWLNGIPLLAGIAATPIAFRAASILALSGTNALTLLYPYVQIVKSSFLRLPSGIANPLAQWVMYLQFPLYGLVMMRLLRSRNFSTALGAVVFLQVAAIMAAYLLVHFENPFLSF